MIDRETRRDMTAMQIYLQGKQDGIDECRERDSGKANVMTKVERASCINTIELLRRLALNVHGVIDVVDNQNCDKIIKMLNNPEPQWIPCSITDDLPDYEVLCCDLRGNMLVGYLYVDESSDTGFGAEGEGECLVDCVAWREKPEPRKGGDAE